MTTSKPWTYSRCLSSNTSVGSDRIHTYQMRRKNLINNLFPAGHGRIEIELYGSHEGNFFASYVQLSPAIAVHCAWRGVSQRRLADSLNNPCALSFEGQLNARILQEQCFLLFAAVVFTRQESQQFSRGRASKNDTQQEWSTDGTIKPVKRGQGRKYDDNGWRCTFWFPRQQIALIEVVIQH